VKLDKIRTVECTDCTTFTRGSHSLFQPAVTLEKERWKRVFGLSHVREGTTQELDIVVVHCSTSICVFFFFGCFLWVFFSFWRLGQFNLAGKKKKPNINNNNNNTQWKRQSKKGCHATVMEENIPKRKF